MLRVALLASAIALLAALKVAFDARRKAVRVDAARLDTKLIAHEVRSFVQEHDRLPSRDELARAVGALPEVPADLRGTPYVVRLRGDDGRDVDVVSAGADRVLGSADDISPRSAR